MSPILGKTTMNKITLFAFGCFTLLALAGCRKKKVCCPVKEQAPITYCEDAERKSGVYDPDVKWETWEKEQYTR